MGGKSSKPVLVNQGVKQGDPLSCHLFNCVIDLALSELDPEIGITVFGKRVNSLAFADDVALISRTPAGLQSNLSSLVNSIAKAGLTISAGPKGKSASLRIDIDGKLKKWIVNPNPYLKVGEDPVPAVSISGAYKYLGIGPAVGGIRARAHEILEEGFSNLTRAPLRPAQRMHFLRAHLIPKLLHQLVLPGVTMKYLTNLDRMTRSAIRGWLRLPKDTPSSYFHADHKDGGLSVPTLRYRIPLLKSKRLSKLSKSSDEVIQAMQRSAGFRRELRKCSQPATLADVAITSSDALRRGLAASLHQSVDGRGLAAASYVNPIHSWVVDPRIDMSGKDYIGAIQLRGNLLYSAVRAARGRPQRETACDCCRRYETLGHILQVCPRTWGSRVARHDRVVSLVAACLRKKGFEVRVEPSIPTPEGWRRPDLILSRNGDVVVCDVTIVSDNANLTSVHEQKVQYYNRSTVREWVRNNIPACTSISFTSVSLNWRGVMAKESFDWLKGVGTSARVRRLISMIVLQEGYKIYLTWRKSAYRVRIGVSV